MTDIPASGLAPDAPATHPIPCPRCGKPSESIKSLDSAILLFIVIGWSLQKSKVIGCPTCCQKALVGKAAVNVVTANVLWPIIILPMTAIGLKKSTVPGHDASVLSALNLPVPTGTSTAPARPLQEAHPFLCRVIGSVQLFLGFAIGVFMMLLVSEEYFRTANARTTSALVGGIGLTFVSYLLVTGVSRLALRVPGAIVRMAAAVAGGIACWLMMDPLVAATWRLREPGFANVAIESPYSYEGENYTWKVPPQFWTAAPIMSLAEHAYESYEIDNLLEKVREYHSADPEFAPIIKLLQEKQAKHSPAATAEPAPELSPSTETPPGTETYPGIESSPGADIAPASKAM